VLAWGDRERGVRSGAWTPAGRSVLFSRRLGDDGKTGLFRVSAEGGEPAKLDLEMDSFYYLGVHPDGTRIIFQSGTSSAEVWVLENFLPTLEGEPTGSEN
jgi:Tol biopolymer transport system component